MKLAKKIILVLALAFPLHLLAHGYWIELEGSHKIKETLTIKLIFGDYHLAEKLAGNKLDKMKDIKVFITLPDGSKQPVDMTQQNDCWKGTFVPQTEGNYTISGINDEREVQDWTKHGLGIVRPVQYLKTVYTVGKKGAEHPSGDWFDLRVQQKANASYEALLTKINRPLDSCYITVVDPAGEENEVKTNKEGKATFAAARPGLHVISVEWIDKTPGTFKGKEYKTVRHRMDYTLYAE